MERFTTFKESDLLGVHSGIYHNIRETAQGAAYMYYWADKVKKQLNDTEKGDGVLFNDHFYNAIGDKANAAIQKIRDIYHGNPTLQEKFPFIDKVSLWEDAVKHCESDIY